MKLYIQRHGIAASHLEDPQRGLTGQGRSGIKELAIQLRNEGVSFNRAFHSGKTRARETAEIMASILAPTATISEYDHLRPNDDPRILLAELDSWKVDTLIASHLPFVPAFLELIPGNIGATSAIPFEPGTIVCLSRTTENDWQFEWVATPDY